ncbi:MAG: MATE family efflux transporter [Cellulophaga sp.]|nr:MATE family efflux transporter [Cellulophaga sp.]
MQQAKRVAKNTGILYIQMAITVIMSLYTTRLVLAALGAEDFGIFNVVGGAIAMLTFLNTAMAAASQRFMSYANGQGDIHKLKNIFNISFKLHIFIAFLVVVLLEVVGYFLLNGILEIDPNRIEVAKLIYQFLVISTFFTIVSVPYDAVINAHENMLLVAILRIVETVLKLLIAIYITYAVLDKLYLYGLLMAGLSIILLIIRQLYCHKKYDEVTINFTKYTDKSLRNQMTSFASWSFLGASTSMIANYGQGIVLNMFFGTVVNAAQGIAVQVSSQLGAFASVMLKALNPVLAKSEGAGDRALMLKASSMGSKISFFLLVIFYVPVLIEMPYIFNFWLKEVPEYAIIFCRLLLLKNLIEQLFLTLSSSIAAVGNIRNFQIYSSILNFLPLLVSYLLFYLGFEPYVLYIVFIAYAILNGIIILYYAKKECNLPVTVYLKNVIVRCVLSFMLIMLIALIPYYSITYGFLRLLVVGLTSTLFFLLVTWFIGLQKEEKIMIKGVLISFKVKIK